MPRAGRVGAEALAEQGVGVVLHRLLTRRAVALQNAPLVAEVEHRLDAARDVAGQQRDGAGRRDGGEQTVADAVRGDRGTHLLGQAPHVGRRQKLLRVEQREGALLARQLGAGEVGGLLDGGHPALGQRNRLGRAVANAAQDQRIGEAGDAEADAALGLRLLPLRRQRIVGDVDGVVEEAHGRGRQRLQPRLVELRLRRERLVDQARQIDRPQQAGAIAAAAAARRKGSSR